MTETILRLLTRLSEAGGDAILPGELASPFLGPVFERLLAKRVLVEQAPLADWDVCGACECGLPCRPIRKSPAGFRAECPLDRRQDVELTEKDLRQYRVDAARLATAISIAAGFAKLPEQIAEGIWLLGNLASGRAVFLALHAAALKGEMIVTALREGAQGDDITILTPPLAVAGAIRLRDAGCHLVETLSVVSPATGGVGATIDPSVLSPTPSAPMLHVRVGAGQVLCGNRSVILSRQIFPVFKRLLDKAVSRDPVASGSYVEGTTSREAKDLIRELRDAFKAAGFTDAEAKVLIASVRNRGYRLGVSASDIIVED